MASLLVHCLCVLSDLRGIIYPAQLQYHPVLINVSGLCGIINIACKFVCFSVLLILNTIVYVYDHAPCHELCQAN